MVLFLIPYVPIPRMLKRIETASSVTSTTVVFWDRGTDVVDNFCLPDLVKKYHIIEKANEGNPLKRIRATLKFCKKAFSILRNENPECIHVTKTDMLLLVWIYCITQKRRPKVIYEISDIHKLALNDSRKTSDVLIRNTLAFMESVGCRIVDHLIVTSELFWSMYYNQWISKDKVIFMPNTPEESVFNGYKKKDSGKFCIGFIGKIRYVDQLKLLVDASRAANIEVLIAGNGVDLNEMIEYCSGMDNVSIYGSYDYKNEIAKLYGSVDCIFSMYDTSIANVQIALPNRLYEAAFCEIPIIVSRGTELSAIVEEEGIGISVADGDLEELMNAILQLKDDIRLRKQIAINCLNFNLKWKFEKVNESLINVYKSYL